MTQTAWLLVWIAVAVTVVAAYFGIRARTKKLRSKFGPEYDRVVRERGGTFKGERELEQREKRVHRFPIHQLSDDEGGRFAAEWRNVQEQFVDDPRGAVAEADQLVHRAMKARGYPVAQEFEDRAADLSVEHSIVVQHYRIAHEIAGRDGNRGASTEDLRIAIKHYRALFEDLLGRHIEEFTEVGR